eukprot:TRINITY_DN13436_c0_g1_i1.p1 TRINITY_DN13436_c0_g1~~TRINITY_DN13436_c0_g1_i1.p1  ORF type:complete len:318 (+),score=52.11 TRINITY_DN13436_c0_g1_i1:44-997(+)
MFRLLVITFFAVAFVAAVKKTVSTSCVWNAPNGYTYDLTPLVREGGMWTGFESSSFSYALNFCTAAISPDCPDDSGSLAIEIGTYGCKPIAPADAVARFSFKNGYDDRAGIIARFYSEKTNIKYELYCNSNEYPQEPFSVKYIAPYYLVQNLMTKAACRSNDTTPTPSFTPSRPPKQCSWLGPDGISWDFSRLAKTGSFYAAAERSSGYQYFVNVCTDVVSPTCPQPGFAGFEYMKQCYSIAALRTPSFRYANGGSPRDGIIMEYTTGGNACSPSPILAFKFVCAADVVPPEPLEMVYSFQDDKCRYTVTFPTSLAC